MTATVLPSDPLIAKIEKIYRALNSEHKAALKESANALFLSQELEKLAQSSEFDYQEKS